MKRKLKSDRMVALYYIVGTLAVFGFLIWGPKVRVDHPYIHEVHYSLKYH